MRMRQKIGLDITRAVLKPVHGEVGSRYDFFGGYSLHSTGQMVSSAHAVLAVLIPLLAAFKC